MTKRDERIYRISYPRRNYVLSNVAGLFGAGFFVGLGRTLQLAGTGMIFLFLLIGLIGLQLLRLQAKIMDSASTNSLPHITDRFLGTHGVYLAVASYVLAWGSGMTSELLAASMILHCLFPAFSTSAFAIILASILYALLRIYDLWIRAEFYIAFIRIFFLIAFSVVAAFAIMGLFPGEIHPVVFFSSLSNNNALPYGVPGLLAAFTGVVMLYGGVESMGTLVTEEDLPKFDYLSASRSTLIRVIFLYVIASFALSSILPADDSAIIPNPFVSSLEMLGASQPISYLANAIIITAAISTALYGLYIPSRIINDTHHILFTDEGSPSGMISRTYPPVILLLAVLAAILSDHVGHIIYLFFFNLSGLGFLSVWALILLLYAVVHSGEHAHSRRALLSALRRTPVSYILLIILAIGLLSMLFTHTGRSVLLAGLLWFFGSNILFSVFSRKLHG